jgi:hypothetical protein
VLAAIVIVSFGEVGWQILGFAGEFFQRFPGDWSSRQRKHLDLSTFRQRMRRVKDHHPMLDSSTVRHVLYCNRRRGHLR